MTTPMMAALSAELEQRERQGLLRNRRMIDGAQGARVTLEGREYLSFCSNDYLGLASHDSLKAAFCEGVSQAGVGTGASHLLTGHHRLHHEAEMALADFVKLPRALLFSCGYMANLGVLSSLLGRNDAVFSDRLDHASLNDAAILSRAKLHRFGHNDLTALEGFLTKSTAKNKIVAVDAVYSMDGDIAPLPELLQLCDLHDAYLLLDDAHGFGVMGANGRGILEHFAKASSRIIYMATLGKSFGVAGAFVAGDPLIIEYLMQTARTYIYTTASPAALASAVIEAIQLVRNEPQRRTHLFHLIETFQKECRLKEWRLSPSRTAIQPIVVGSNEKALSLSEYLLSSGILVPAIRPPTVPQGSSRLRVSISASHSLDDIHRLISALKQAEKLL